MTTLTQSQSADCQLPYYRPLPLLCCFVARLPSLLPRFVAGLPFVFTCSSALAGSLLKLHNVFLSPDWNARVVPGTYLYCGPWLCRQVCVHLFVVVVSNFPCRSFVVVRFCSSFFFTCFFFLSLCNKRGKQKTKMNQKSNLRSGPGRASLLSATQRAAMDKGRRSAVH